MPEDALNDVRITAERVGRFAEDVERDDSVETRNRWRASLEDLRFMIRRARARGCDTEAIQEATGDQPTGRFVRPPVAELGDSRAAERAA